MAGRQGSTVQRWPWPTGSGARAGYTINGELAMDDTASSAVQASA